jgi:hypothetical protein
MDHRLEIPSDTDPEWASMIESCWDRYILFLHTTKQLIPDSVKWLPFLCGKMMNPFCEQWTAMPPLVPWTPWDAPGDAKTVHRAGSDTTESIWERSWKGEHQRELALLWSVWILELPQPYGMVFHSEFMSTPCLFVMVVEHLWLWIVLAPYRVDTRMLFALCTSVSWFFHFPTVHHPSPGPCGRFVHLCALFGLLKTFRWRWVINA